MRFTPLAAGVAARILAALAAHATLPFDLRPILVGEIALRVRSALELEGENGFAVNRLRFGALPARRSPRGSARPRRLSSSASRRASSTLR
jgi:hypothetical protein